MKYKQDYHETERPFLIPIIPNHEDFYKEIGKIRGRIEPPEKILRKLSRVSVIEEPELKMGTETWKVYLERIIASSSLHEKHTHPDFLSSSSFQDAE